MKTRLKSSVPVLVLVTASSCQTVLGDFTIEPAPVVPPETLGTTCEPGEYRCTNEFLETCSDDRSGFVVAETCPSASECNVNTRSCRSCTPNERMCRGNVLERCNESADWVTDIACATAELCNVAPDHMSGSCTPPVCAEPGAHRCEDAKLVRCAAGRQRFEAVALCETPELCDAAHADELAAAGARGACRPPACAPDEWRCDGATLRHCALDRAKWNEADETVCDSPDLCNVSAGACAACEPGSVECNGAELRRCRAAGGWETIARCDAAALCDAVTGTCRRGECNEPGSLRCGSGVLLERCSEELTWEVVEACMTAALCSVTAGRCLAPACGDQATRCNGSRHERCRSDRTRWDVVETCGADEMCDPDAGCVPAPCTEGSLRCNDASLERCVSARFQEIERCRTPALCDETMDHCTPPVCTEPFVCDGSTTIRKCRPALDGLDYFRDCPTGTMCDATAGVGTGVPECDACTPNVYECDGMKVVRCSSDGQERVTVGTCATSCSMSGGMPSCG